MYNFSFMLKTYRNDIDYVSRLVETFEKHNQDNIHLFIIAPPLDLSLFKQKYSSKENISVLSEAEIKVQYAEIPINEIRPGYINQEIVKLAFWELGLCQNYMCLDSDGWFIRDFYINDFMYDDNIPYTVLIEDNDLKANPNYYDTHWKGREEQIKLIQKELDYHPKHLLTCHGFQIFNSTVLRSMKTEYMEPNNLSYLDLMRIAPYEFSWYNIWLQKTQIIPLHICEPLFKYYHMAYQQFGEVIAGITEKSLSRAYIGVTLCNYKREKRIISINDIDKISYIPSKENQKKIISAIFKHTIQKIKLKLRKIYYIVLK